MSRKISSQEVAQHATEKDCWLIVHNKVYDVSRYLNDHPGGVEIVTDLAGQDATVDYDDVGHTQEANEILEKFLIGELSADAPIPPPSATATPAAAPAAAPVTKPPPSAAPVAPISTPPPKVSSTIPVPASASTPKKSVPAEDDGGMMMIGAGVAVAAVAMGFFLYRRSKA